MYSIYPWECRHSEDHSEILAYVEASSQWEVVSVIHSTSGASAETISNFICHVINDHQSSKNLLTAAMDALQLCMDEANLTFASEQAADHVLRRAHKIKQSYEKAQGKKSSR